MRLAIIIPLSLLLVGCHRSVPKFSEAKLQEIRADSPGITDACLDKIRWGGIEAMPEATDQCFVMTKPARWRGLWEAGWEWSNFCPAPTRECPPAAEHGDIWLEFGKDAYKGPGPEDGLYEVEFVGRRTKLPGTFGHLGQYDHQMIVDQMISMKQIKPPPPEPTKAEIVADMKACEANRTCIPDWNAINQMDDSKK